MSDLSDQTVCNQTLCLLFIFYKMTKKVCGTQMRIKKIHPNIPSNIIGAPLHEWCTGPSPGDEIGCPTSVAGQ